MGIYVYYVLIGFYGWYHWGHSNNQKANGRVLPIQRVSLRLGIILLFITGFLFLLIVFILKKYTPSDIPYLDAFTTALSITATWMLTQKIMEHWIIWIIVDSVSVGLYFYKELALR